MIEKLSPTLEMALQNELREAYLKGIDTGRRLEREAQSDKIKDASEGSYSTKFTYPTHPIGMTDYTKLTAYAKREERERILGIIEYYITELSDETTAERLAKRWLRRCATTIERLD